MIHSILLSDTNTALMQKIGYDLSEPGHVAGFTKGVESALSCFTTRVSGVHNTIKDNELAMNMITTITTVFNRLFKQLDIPLTEEETLEELQYKKFLDRHADW